VRFTKRWGPAAARYPFPVLCLSLVFKVCQPRPVANLNFSRATKSQHHNLAPYPHPQYLKMPPEIVPSDSDYASEEDSDFAPDAAPAQEAESSDSESEGDEPTSIEKAKPKSKKRKRAGEEEVEDLGFENSGDEAIIKEYEAPKRKKGKKGRAAELEDEGGEGGFVRTRSMRAVEYVLSFYVGKYRFSHVVQILTMVVMQKC
jgi:hypothetical protein